MSKTLKRPNSRSIGRREAEALAELIGESVRLHGRLVTASDRMAKDLGLTGARWQLLSVISRGQASYTVSELARWMGLARQSVQRLADALADEGLVAFRDNPKHRRAQLLELTAQGRRLLGRLDERRFRWARDAGANLGVAEIQAAAGLLRSVRQRLAG